VIAHDAPRWVVSGPPRSGVSAVIFGRLDTALRRDPAARALALVVDRRAETRAARVVAPEILGRVRLESYLTLAQRLVSAWWPLVASRFGIAADEPEFLPFDVTQYACREEFRRDPGALSTLTIREPRLIVQLIDNMNLAAAHGLPLDETWRRVAAGLQLPVEDEVIQAGYAVTRRLRQRCLDTGVLPFDLQVEAATWLLSQRAVVDDLASEYGVLAVDGLDEMVPALASALCGLAGRVERATLGYSTDGGLRWMLGASATHAGLACAALRRAEFGGFRHVRLRAEHRPEASRRACAGDLARLAADPLARPSRLPRLDGWRLSVLPRPDLMARVAVERAADLVALGASPDGIVLLSPYLDAVVASELLAGFEARGIPFTIERHWRSLFDDPAARACLTALRAARPGGRRVAPVEAADLLGTLLGRNPIAVQPLSGRVLDARRGRFRSREEVERRAGPAAPPLPQAVAHLLDWAATVETSDDPIDHALALLASDVLGCTRPSLESVCAGLVIVARRFAEAAPRFGFDTSLASFFAFIDSEVIAADDTAGALAPGVTLTTPYGFLTAGRVAAHQFWLDVASPYWWDPPLLLLTNPHAIASGASLDIAHDEGVRGEVLGRVIRNLAARADDAIHALASSTGTDGQHLDGPLLAAFYDLGLVES